MYKDLFNEIGGQVDELRIACERQEVYYKTMISTYEVTSGQQVIQIKKLEQAVEELKVDSANRQTAIDIERKKLINKHDELKSLGRAERDNAQEGWDLADSYNIKIEEYQEILDEQVTEIKNLQMELKSSDAEMDSLLEQNEILYGTIEEHTLVDDSLILQYTGVIEVEDNPFPGKTTPVPYPYTHPIREVPEYSKVHIPV